MSIQILAITLSIIVVLGTLGIIFFKTNGSVSKGHVSMMFLGFFFLLVACDVVPSELSFGKDFKVVFAKQTYREIVAVRSEMSRSAASGISLDELGSDS